MATSPPKSEIRNLKSEIPHSQSPRRWFRFSLGTLFLCLSVGCVVLGAVVNRAQRQALAVAMVKQLGGRVHYHDAESDGIWKPGHARLPGSDWLRARLGNDYFDDVVAVNLSDRIKREPPFDYRFQGDPRIHVTDDQLALLRHLTKLRDLVIDDPDITDEGCRHLATLPALEFLLLRGTRISNASLARLGRLHKLRVLRLENCRVTSDGLASLADLHQLIVLDLSGTQVDDAGAERLAKFSQLQRVCLKRTRVSDRGLRALASLPLHHLWLDETRVTDAGLAHLREHTTLDTLRFCNTAVSDEGVGHLATIPHLSDLGLDNTRLTDAGAKELARCKGLTQLWVAGNHLSPEVIERLKEALPNCDVVAD